MSNNTDIPNTFIFVTLIIIKTIALSGLKLSRRLSFDLCLLWNCFQSNSGRWKLTVPCRRFQYWNWQLFSSRTSHCESRFCSFVRASFIMFTQACLWVHSVKDFPDKEYKIATWQWAIANEFVTLLMFSLQ